MVLVRILLLCGVVLVAEGRRLQVTLDADIPFVRKEVTDKVMLECCYRHSASDTIEHTWIITTVSGINNSHNLQPVNVTDSRVSRGSVGDSSRVCHKLTLVDLRFSDAGLYQCFLNSSTQSGGFMSHGTFLQVYKPLAKMLNMSEGVKNGILSAQGILLLLCVLLPGAKLLCKSREIYALEKKKAMREEENIYEGLRIEDFSSPYDQIQRAPAEVTYQDVYLNDGEAHLEKP